MRNLLISLILVVSSLSVGSMAFAAAPPTNHSTAKPATTAQGPTAKPASGEKQQACNKTWQSQKKHIGARKAFMQACVAKG